MEKYNEKKDHRHDRNTVSWHWGIIVVGLGCLLYYNIHLLDHVLPEPIMAHETLDNPDLFSAERARASLRSMVAIGPRVIGNDANEKYTPDLIKSEVDAAIRGAHPSQNIEIEKQIGSGSFRRVERETLAFTSVYINVQNVIVFVEGSEKKHSILVNCHYDSVPEVDGASDDAISCAVMLELIRVLSSRSTRLKHNVVFLFNGAEEAGLLASHLFLQHEWSKQCRIFINLEAAGVGGRAILFQSGPNHPWLMDYYSKYVPHPHGMVLAEELFQAGVIPSDTDFRNFNEYGKMAGYDIAFSRSGQLYHTKYDAEQYIDLGCYQHMGENSLALLKTLGNAPELDEMDKHAEGKVVFYDYLGWFIVRYSAGAGIAINIVVIIIACLSISVFIGRLLNWSWLSVITKSIEKLFSCKKDSNYDDEPYDEDMILAELNSNWDIMKEFLIAILARILGMAVALGVTLIVALIINSAAALAIPWYANVWLLFPFYWCPCIIIYCLVSYLVDFWRSKKNNMSICTRTHMNIIASQVPPIIIFFIITVMGIRSAYIFLLQVFFSAVANLIIFLTPLYRSTIKWIWVYLLFHMPSLIFHMYLALLGYVIFNPIVGRSGVTNGDVTIALVSAGLCIFVTNFIVPLVILLRRPGIALGVLTVFSFVTIIVALTTNVGHPYRAGPDRPMPQRYNIIHAFRELRNQSGHIRISETGYFVINLDENSPHTLPVRETKNIRGVESDCSSELFCALPFYTTRTLPLSSESSWIPASRSYQPVDTELILINGRRTCQESTASCSFSFRLTGPDRMTLTFAARNGASLDSWTLDEDLETPLRFDDRPVYLLHIVHGRIDKDFEITLTFKVSKEQLEGAAIFDIGLAGNHVHHESYRTKDFQDFLDAMPDWTDRSGWISAYKGYVF